MEQSRQLVGQVGVAGLPGGEVDATRGAVFGPSQFEDLGKALVAERHCPTWEAPWVVARPARSALTRAALFTEAAQGADVENADGPLAAAQPLGEGGVRQFIDVPAEEDLLHVLGQAGEGVSHAGGLFVPNRLLAGRAAGVGHLLGEGGTGFLAAGVALAGCEMTAESVPGRSQHDRPQPGGELSHRGPLEARRSGALRRAHPG